MVGVGGEITCLEVALTTPRGLDVIENLANVDGLTIGVGTALDAQAAASAIRAGTAFLLSPAVVSEIIQE